MRAKIHYFLIASLLMLSCLQLSHQAAIQAHVDNVSCEFCLHVGHLSDGASYTPTLPIFMPAPAGFRLPGEASAPLPLASFLRPATRAPPGFSLA